MIYLQLFFSFVKIGLLSFGGGYAVLPLIEEEIVHKQQFLTAKEYVDLLSVGEIVPGPVGINAATFAGNRVAGISGGFAATLGILAPSIAIVLTLGYLYHRYKNLDIIQGIVKGLSPASIALIASAATTLILTAFFNTTSLPIDFSSIDWLAVILFCLSLYLLHRYQINSLWILALTGLVGAFAYSFI